MALSSHTHSHPSFDYSSLQQKYPELSHCSFFRPAPEQISLIWEIVLTERWPCHNKIRRLKLRLLGNLTTSSGVQSKVYRTRVGTRLVTIASLQSTPSLWFAVSITTTRMSFDCQLSGDTQLLLIPCFNLEALSNQPIFQTPATCQASSSTISSRRKP